MHTVAVTQLQFEGSIKIKRGRLKSREGNMHKKKKVKQKGDGVSGQGVGGIITEEKRRRSKKYSEIKQKRSLDRGRGRWRMISSRKMIRKSLDGETAKEQRRP